MDQDTANKLFEVGAIFLFLDVPEKTEFGIDYNSWQTGPNFKGVKMIPPGLHFIYFNPTDKYGHVGLRSGFFYNFEPKEIVAKNWNLQNESIDDYCFSEEEIERFKSNKQDLDRFLGSYPYDEYKRWISLTSNLNESFVFKLVPDLKIISSGSCLIGESFHGKSTEHLFQAPKTMQEAESRLPHMTHQKGTNINFSQIPSKYYPQGTDPHKITQSSIDLSDRLEQLIRIQDSNENNLLCELQFSFVCFLIGQVYDAFEQWKNLVHLLCNCEKAIGKYTKVYVELINILYFQLKEMPDDYFSDILLQENFLTINLHNLFENISYAYHSDKDKNSLKNLNEKCSKFKNYLQQRFNLSFDSCPDEYQPVVVSETAADE